MQPGPRFDNQYARLPGGFFRKVAPTPVAAPRLLLWNSSLAAELGLDDATWTDADRAQVFSGNRLLPSADPIATAYAGHQFGNFVPQLGDGRAILLGEVLDRAGHHYDVQLKGAGPTPYSRRGDGRAAIGPVLREYLVSEWMHRVGVPTTRALAAVATGEPVFRESTRPGAVLTRIAPSHVRVGTFQFFANRGDQVALRALASFVIDRHYPSLRTLADEITQARALFTAIVAAQAQLVAGWMAIGFVHGVMNTDNCSVAGITIDYGPCAFVDAYDPTTVFSSIDHHGRYAFANQPKLAVWNLARLAEAMLPLFADDEPTAAAWATGQLTSFRARYAEAWHARMSAKLGLPAATAPQTVTRLGEGFLELMHQLGLDFTLSFRRLMALAHGDAGPLQALIDARHTDAEPDAIHAWARTWRDVAFRDGRSPSEVAAALAAVNPIYIPRNHQIERALEAAALGDLGPVTTLTRVLADPFTEVSANADFSVPAQPGDWQCQTFCGT